MRSRLATTFLAISTVLVVIAGFFAHFVDFGPKTTLSIEISIIASKPALFLFTSPSAHYAALAIAHLLSIFVYLAPSLVAYFAFRNRSLFMVFSVITCWMTFYVLLLLFLFPATAGFEPW